MRNYIILQDSARALIRYLSQSFGKLPMKVCGTLGYVALLFCVLISSAVNGQNCQFFVGEISGPSNACLYIGSKGDDATYTINTTDASGFAWTIPAQATLISGQGTNTIHIKYINAFKAGTISIQVSSACGGEPLSRTLAVSKMAPAMPVSVDGPATVCDLTDGTTLVTFTVPPVPDATQYRWATPTQTAIISGQGTNSIQVVFMPNFKAGQIKVKAVSKCGSSGSLSYGVNSKGPGRPGPIAGQANGICGDNNTIGYRISAVRFATSYTWSTTVPGAVIVSEGVNATITFPPFTNGTVGVSATGNCGVSGARMLGVSSRGLSPDSIIGPKVACQGTVQSFSVAEVEGAISYQWSVPNGSVINSGAGTPNITVTIGGEGGVVNVRSTTACAASNSVMLDLAVEQCAPEVPKCKLSIYPVPTCGLLHVRFHTLHSGAYHIYVADAITGAVLYCNKGTYQSGDNQFCLDLSAFRDGYYVIHVVTNEFDHQERIEIRH